jgi:hypothetical protein
MALKQYRVTGILPVRDAQTKESVPTGELVWLDDAEVPRPHIVNGRRAKPLAGTNILALLACGAIAEVEPAKTKKAD